MCDSEQEFPKGLCFRNQNENIKFCFLWKRTNLEDLLQLLDGDSGVDVGVLAQPHLQGPQSLSAALQHRLVQLAVQFMLRVNQ